jgi:hypothetical protein
MRYALLVTLLVGLVMVGTAQADEILMTEIANTGAFLCNAGTQDIWVQNPAQRDIKIKAVELWMGMDWGGVADFSAAAYTYSRVTNRLALLHFAGWDHYTSPTAPGNYRKSFNGDWVSLGASEWLRLVASCAGQPVHGHVALYIEYTTQ